MISDIINHNIELSQKTLISRKPLVHWPSQAGCKIGDIHYGECARKIFWQINGIPWTNPMATRIQRIGNLGSSIENNELKYAKGPVSIYVDSHIPFRYEIDPKITITGEIDAIYVVDDIYYGIEYKTGFGWYFRKDIFGTNTTAGFPKSKDLLQVIIYLDYYMNNHGLKIDTFKLIYIDRGKGDTQEFNITLSPEKKALIDNELVSEFSVYDIINEFKYIQTHVEQNNLPSCSYRNTYDKNEIKYMLRNKLISKNQYTKWIKLGYGMDWECEYCGYLDKCLAIENNE